MSSPDKQAGATHTWDIADAVAGGVPTAVLEALEALTDAQRRSVFYVYCTDCGAKDSDCQCMNDE